MHLALPLSEWTPYLQRSEQDPLAEIVRRRASFEVGYFVSSPAAQSLARPVQTNQGEAFYFDPFPVYGQKTLDVGLPMEISVRTHMQE